MNKIIKILHLPAAVLAVLKNISTQRKFMRGKLDPILHDAIQRTDGSLDEADLKKINHYYGLAVPAILGEAYCALRGRAMSAEERWSSTCQGAMTGLFDDFFDKDYLSNEAVESMISGNNTTPKRSNQQLFDFFYKNALQGVPDKNIMQLTLRNVYHAQVGSKKQKGPISREVLTDLTYEKGGSSVIFYRSAFVPVASPVELKLLYNLGGMMQLANDIFDVYKDREAGIRTLITETKDINAIRTFFKQRLHEYYRDAFNLGFPKQHVRSFLNILSIGIFSRCFVCLNQLEDDQRSTGNVFDVHQYRRKQLICDMDKKRNILRSAWSFVKDFG